MCGALARLAGIAYGQFSEGTGEGRGVDSHGDSEPNDPSSCALDDVLREAADIAGVPAMAGIPLGHIDDQWTVPLGAMAELDAEAHTLHVALA